MIPAVYSAEDRNGMTHKIRLPFSAMEATPLTVSESWFLETIT